MDIYAIESSALPAEARVHSFHGREALCRPYRFDVHVTVPNANDVDLGDAIGAKVALTMQCRTSGSSASPATAATSRRRRCPR